MHDQQPGGEGDQPAAEQQQEQQVDQAQDADTAEKKPEGEGGQPTGQQVEG